MRKRNRESSRRRHRRGRYGPAPTPYGYVPAGFGTVGYGPQMGGSAYGPVAAYNGGSSGQVVPQARYATAPRGGSTSAGGGALSGGGGVVVPAPPTRILYRSVEADDEYLSDDSEVYIDDEGFEYVRRSPPRVARTIRLSPRRSKKKRSNRPNGAVSAGSASWSQAEEMYPTQSASASSAAPAPQQVPRIPRSSSTQASAAPPLKSALAQSGGSTVSEDRFANAVAAMLTPGDKQMLWKRFVQHKTLNGEAFFDAFRAQLVADAEEGLEDMVVQIHGADPAEKARLETKIMEKYSHNVTVFISTFSGLHEITRARGVNYSAGLIFRMRAIVRRAIDECAGFVVKAEGEKMFVTFMNPCNAVKAAVLAMLYAREYNRGLATEEQIHLQIGVESGDKTLLIPHDLYGNAVNVASKLGEDTAEADEILISQGVFEEIRAIRKTSLDWSFRERTAERSHVQLNFSEVVWGRLEVEDVAAIYTERSADDMTSPAPTLSPFAALCLDRVGASPRHAAEIDSTILETYGRDCVVFVSDMSGFTKVTKSHGILHFLSLIFNMRAMVEPIFLRHGGQVINTEADNFMTVFANSLAALYCSIAIMEMLREFNASAADRASMILMKIGLSKGSTLIVHEEEMAFGAPKDLATQLGEERAEPNEILIDEEVFADLEAELVSLEDKLFFEPKVATDGEDPKHYFQLLLR